LDRGAQSSYGIPVQLIVYGLARSVYTRVVRLALEEKGLAYALEEVEIFTPDGAPASHRERHPFGRIPVLRHGEFLLYETAAITRYVDEGFDGPSLQPRDPRGRARMNQIIGILDAYAYRPMVWGVFVPRVLGAARAAREEDVTKALAACATSLRALAGLMAEQQFLAGSELSLADLHAFPMLKYLSLAADGAALVREHASLRRWIAAMDARPSARRTRGPYE
jgi:glutathione S-transferase